MIQLRFPTPDDAAELNRAVRESLDDLAPWMDWATPDYDVYKAREWIDMQPANREDGAAYEFMIVEGDRILGACGVNRISAPPLKLCNLGYWVRTSEAGRGICTEAVRQLSEWVWTNTELVRLEIVVAAGNLRSERVAEKSGALREGALRARLWTAGEPQDATMFGLIRPGV